MKVVKGNLIKLAARGEFDVIAHGCNCFCAMGAGIARDIKSEFSAAFEADQRTVKGDRGKMGTCSVAHCVVGDVTVVVVNAYTQYHWAGEGVLADYPSIRSCMRFIKERFAGKRIGLPRIGAGLARGDWDTIVGIIQDELGHEDVTIVEFAQ